MGIANFKKFIHSQNANFVIFMGHRLSILFLITKKRIMLTLAVSVKVLAKAAPAIPKSKN